MAQSSKVRVNRKGAQPGFAGERSKPSEPGGRGEGTPRGTGRLGAAVNPAWGQSVLQAQQAALWPGTSCSVPDTQKEEKKPRWPLTEMGKNSRLDSMKKQRRYCENRVRRANLGTFFRLGGSCVGRPGSEGDTILMSALEAELQL